jgi:hypothetical protein
MHEIIFENLRNPARRRCAGAMCQFRSGQVYSILLELNSVLNLVYILNLVVFVVSDTVE